MPIEEILAATAVLLILSIFESKASGRLGVPALILFLGLGMLAGSEGIGGIHFDNVRTAERLGIIALAYSEGRPAHRPHEQVDCRHGAWTD